MTFYCDPILRWIILFYCTLIWWVGQLTGYICL